MLFILTVALLPLGLGAGVTSMQSARSKMVQHREEVRLVATAEARQIDLLVIRGADIVRFAAGTVGDNATRCRTIIDETRRLLGHDVGIALYARDGRLRCASPGSGPAMHAVPRRRIGADVALDADGGLTFAVNALDGSYGIGRLPPAMLRSAIMSGSRRQGVELREEGRRLVLAATPAPRRFDDLITATAPIAGGQAMLVATTLINAVTSFEILLVVLPLLAWAAAALIGWLVVNQLLLRPLRHLEQAVAAFGADEHAAFALPRLQSPATEIEALGHAFAAAAGQIASREAALEQGLQHQVRLTREVHHRVKNNLQVVASLINLHARGAAGAVADAYASIQRRVDALAVVHRNHYAELEDNRGVALRTLLAELTANLRATAPTGAGGTPIMLDMPQAHVSQDTAVPVAFLVTEFVELLMVAAPGTPITVSLAPDAADRGLLTVRSRALIGDGCRDDPAFPRFERIVTGLSRQLRSTLRVDPQDGSYAIAIPILD